VDLVRFGVVVRALRRRRGWRQVDLGRAAGVSQALVSRVERGHADRVLLANVIAVCAALEARVFLDVRWRAGELDRLLDADHAALSAAIARTLRACGWHVEFEVTYAVYGAHGSIDVFAWHPATESLLVIEIKTEVTSAEATMRKLDEKVRLAAQIALQRFGWRARTVSKLLVIEGTATARRRVQRAGDLFDASFPSRGASVRHWLRKPAGTCSGLLFLSPSTTGSAIAKNRGRHRVRRPRDGDHSGSVSTNLESAEHLEPSDGPTVLTNRR
jgi:transcriptional regulator with XRE-family HTH domain